MRALGISLRLQLRLAEAVTALGHAAEAAVAHEDECGDSQPLADVLLSRAFVYALTGDGAAAESDLAHAERRLPSAQHPTLWMQRAGVLGLLGRDLEALSPATRAVERHRRRREPLELGRALQTRAARQQSLGRLDAAQRDSLGAIRAYDQAGNRAGSAMCRYNLAAITAFRGDLPLALRRFDAAEVELTALGIDVALGAEGRLEALLRSRLFVDALDASRRIAGRLESTGAHSLAGQAHVHLARAALGLGLAAVAADAAHDALRLCDPSSAWADLARLVLLHTNSNTSASELLELAEALDRRGWAAHAVNALLRSITAHDANPEHVSAVLERAARGRAHPIVETQLLGWAAETQRRHRDGDLVEARAAAETGLRLLGEHRRSLAAVELRVAAGGHGDQLITVGLRLALAERRPDVVAQWLCCVAEATADLPQRHFQTGSNRTVGSLRAVSGRIEQLILAGRPIPAAVLARRAALESELRARDLRVAGERSGVQSLTKSHRPERPTVCWIQSDGKLHALVLNPNSDPRLVSDIAAEDDVVAQIRRVRGLLAAVARGRSRAHTDAFLEARAALDSLLVRPLGRIGDDALCVASAVTAPVPWGVFGDRSPFSAVSTLPLALGLKSRPARPRATSVVAFAGPRLRAARGEAIAVAQVWDCDSAVVGRASVAARLYDALSHASIVHIAAHVRSRSDNPSFSSVLCADGPLLLAELESVRSLAKTITIAGCEAGHSTPVTGGELIGMPMWLLGLGANDVIAPALPIDDATTLPVMVELHRRIQAGAAPRTALREVQNAAQWSSNPRRAALAASFVCFSRA